MTWGIVPDNATMLRAPLVGSRRKAKSRDGSHISVSVLGRYPPTECVRLFVRCIDRFRRLEETLLLFFFSMNASYPLSRSCAPSLLSIDAGGLDGGSPLEDELPCEVDDFCEPSLKMWTVSCAELTANNDDTTLKFIEYIRASLVPRLN